MRGSGGATASSPSVIGRSSSYVTAIRSSAAVATSSLAAATAATGSPTKRTLSSASACSSWLTGRMPNGIGRSWPVSTAFTPGNVRARDVSMAVMRAWGWGLRSSLAYSMRGRNRSAANLVAPVTLAVASTLRIAFPTTRKAAGRFLRVPIQGLPRRLGLLPAHARRGQFHGLVDLQVSGAAAQVARQRLLDLVTRGSRVLAEQRFRGEQEGGRAVPALRRAELGEGVLERMQRPASCNPLDGFHATPRAREAEHQTGQHGLAIHEHGAGAALAQLAAVLRAGETQVFAQHFEQGLVGRESDLDGLAVQLERDLHFGVGHLWKPNLDNAWLGRELSGPKARARWKDGTLKGCGGGRCGCSGSYFPSFHRSACPPRITGPRLSASSRPCRSSTAITTFPTRSVSGAVSTRSTSQRPSRR